MGKSMELMVPMNEDVNIYDGTDIHASAEKKSKNSWVEMFDMIDLAFNNLQQQNKDLKRTVNELSSKINKVVFHERKETKKADPASEKKNEKTEEYSMGQVQEINRKVESKIQKVEENILQWIDEETKCLKDGLEKDLASIRTEVDTKNIELNSKVTATISNLKEDMNEKVSQMDSKLNETMFANDDLPLDDNEPEVVAKVATKQILDLKNKLHHNCNTLRFLCSEPLSVQFSIWNKKEVKVGLTEDNQIIPFNWVNCNSVGALPPQPRGQHDLQRRRNPPEEERQGDPDGARPLRYHRSQRRRHPQCGRPEGHQGKQHQPHGLPSPAEGLHHPWHHPLETFTGASRILISAHFGSVVHHLEL